MFLESLVQKELNKSDKELQKQGCLTQNSDFSCQKQLNLASNFSLQRQRTVLPIVKLGKTSSNVLVVLPSIILLYFHIPLSLKVSTLILLSPDKADFQSS